MKKLLPFIMLAVLSGCNTVPVVRKFPDVPDSQLVACPDLEQASANIQNLSDVLPSVVDNYNLYYVCKNKDDAWIQWYTTQKKIFENIGQ